MHTLTPPFVTNRHIFRTPNPPRKCDVINGRPPTHNKDFLGFSINTINFRLSLTEKRKQKISNSLTSFENKTKCTIEQFASLIGQLVAACQASVYGWLYTKKLEREKILALKANSCNYNKKITLSDTIKADLKWWQENISNINNPMNIRKYHKIIFTDASRTGWGATDGNKKVLGHWTANEKHHHINYLELLAIKYALEQIAPFESNMNILLRVDNTTAISYINKMGGVQLLNYIELSRTIWQWAEQRNIFLFASYIQSKDNKEADYLSRIQNPDTEYSLSNEAFYKIKKEFGHPKIDLFASNKNYKCNTYVSRFPDKHAYETDAFTFSWHDLDFYAFPPISLISKTLNKINEDNARGLLVVPDWPNQPWYPMFHSMLERKPIYLDNKYSVFCPYRHSTTPAQETKWIVGMVCADHT